MMATLRERQPVSQAIDFWFSTGSTYTYLTVSRLPKLAAAEGVTFNWRPFSVRAIMREQNNIPFVGKPVKTAYMWRDIERRAAMYGLRVQVPVPYPLKEFDLTHRLAILGLTESWGIPYLQASYRRWFADGLEPGLEPNLSQAWPRPARMPSAVSSGRRATTSPGSTTLQLQRPRRSAF